MYEFRGHNFPAFIILMTGASEEHYLPCLEEIKKLVPSFNLKRAKGDMERAARNAILQAFAFLLAFLVSYCVFHYAQSLLRNIGYKGLLKQFKRKSKGGFVNYFYKWVKLVMALPFLPHHKIATTWKDLCLANFDYFDATDQLNLKRFKTYVTNQWVEGSISLKELSVFGQKNATNNAHERSVNFEMSFFSPILTKK